MRATYLIAFSSAAIFATSVAVARQDQTVLAEQQFKNIQVFKGQKASDVIPAMQFMCAALGKECDFCHTSDRASDDKRPKEAARHMIEMTREINKTNFNGRIQVTCATCHAGHEHPVATPPTIGASVRLLNDSSLSADTILGNFDTAVGGANASKITTIQMEGTMTEQGKTSKLVVTRQGDKFVTERPAPPEYGGMMKLGFNGTACWFSNGKSSSPLPAEEAGPLGHMAAVYTGKASIPSLEKPQAGTAQLDGKDVVGIRGTLDGDVQAYFFFDKKSSLLVQASFFTPTILGRIPLVVDYSDFKKINGVQIPAHVQVHSEEGDQDCMFKSIHTDAKVDAGFFDMPKG